MIKARGSANVRWQRCGGPAQKAVGSSPSARRNINAMNITLRSRRCTFPSDDRVHLMATGQEKSLDRFAWHHLRSAFPHMDQGARKVMWYGKKYCTVEVSVEDGDIKRSHFLMMYEP